MKRSGGVTAAAIVALMGSAGIGLVAVSELSGALFISRFHPGGQALPQSSAIPVAVGMVVGSLFNLAFAGWGLATGIGLIRLRPWSRISTLVYAGLTAVCTAFAAVIFLFIPMPANTGQNFSAIFRAIMEGFFAIPACIAIWWLILFTRKSVVAQFSGTLGPAVTEAIPAAEVPVVPFNGPTRPQRPMVITILAWFFLISCISSVPAYFLILFGPLKNMPVPFFGGMLHGKAVLIYYPVSVLLLAAAWGALLKNKVWGYWLALAIQLFNFLNMAIMLALPGRAERLQVFMESGSFNFPPGAGLPSNFLETMVAIGLGTGLIFSIVILCFLLISRKRFFEIAAMEHPISSAG